MRTARSALAWVLVLLASGIACRARSAAVRAPVAAITGDVDHCWWSTNRSALPPDSVAARFERAFAAVGLTGVARAREADTAWVQTAPTVLPGIPTRVPYAMWAVAYRAADSTRYRYFVAAIRSASRAGPSEVIPLCTAVARAAAIPGVQPPQPTGEESLDVWRRRP